MNELSGLKKGKVLGTVTATIIPALIQNVPYIINFVQRIAWKDGVLRLEGVGSVFWKILILISMRCVRIDTESPKTK